jgi:hypothetical protein
MHVRVKRATNYAADAFQPGSHIDLVALGAGADFPDPVDVLGGIHEDTWLGPATLRRLDALAQLSGTARVSRAAAFVRQIVQDDALVVPYSHQIYPMFVAERIGCGFVQPALGAVDLLSLCMR